MAEKKKTSESEEERDQTATIKGYEKILDRLRKEQIELRDGLERDYREARGYVRTHPEEGILVSFIGGLALGLLLGGLTRRR